MKKTISLFIILLIFLKLDAKDLPKGSVVFGNSSSNRIDSLGVSLNKIFDSNLGEPKPINSEPKLIFQTKKMIGIKSNWAKAGLEYTNSKNYKLMYSKPLNISSGVSLYLRNRFTMLEFGTSYSQISSTYKTTGLISTIALDQANVEIIPSLLLFSGPTRLKIGSGISGAYIVKGTQYNNGLEYDLLKDTYKRFSFSSISEVGLVILPKRYFMIQIIGFYSIGLSNIEKNENQTSKINGYGISTGLSFTL